MKQKEHISDWAVDQAEIERLTQKLNGIRELAEDRMREIKTLWAEIERLKAELAYYTDPALDPVNDPRNI